MRANHGWRSPNRRRSLRRTASVSRLRRLGLLRLLFRWSHSDWRVRATLALGLAYAVLVGIPAVTAWTVHRGVEGSPISSAAHLADARRMVRVYRMETGTVSTISLRDYVMGVVAAQLPPDAPLAALEADAVAVRTYAVRARLGLGNTATFARNHGADVTDDPSLDLPLLTAAQRAERYGDNDAAYEARLAQVVAATDGQVLTFQGQPILAFTCALSPGQTRDASRVFGQSLPYLPSVTCPDDAKAPELERMIRLNPDALKSALGLPGPVQLTGFRVAAVDPWGFALTVSYPGHSWSGDVFAAKLHLPTSRLSFSVQDRVLVVQTKGIGAGLGMSLHEASAMAASGAGYQAILATFYPGAKLVSSAPFYTNNQ